MSKCTCGRKEFSFSIADGKVTKTCQCGEIEVREIRDVIEEGCDNAQILAKRARYNLQTIMRMEPGTPCWEHTVGRSEKLQRMAATTQAVMYLKGSMLCRGEGHHDSTGWMIAPDGSAVEAIA